MTPTLRTTRRRLTLLENLQRKRHRSWLAAFSANEYRELWSFATLGHTKPDKRESVRGKSKLLDAVMERYLMARPGGGRFFLTSKGAFFRPQGSPERQFLKFRLIKMLKCQGLY
jgi:hypothetical protein